MTKTTAWMWAAGALGLALSAGTASAAECSAFRAEHQGEPVWECYLAYNGNSHATSLTGCFASKEAGLEWLGHESGHAAGNIEMAHCDSGSERVGLGDLLPVTK